MKKIAILSALLFASVATTFAQTTWAVDKAHAKVGFSITHMMLSDVEGNFKSFDSKIVSSKDDLSDAQFSLTANINSVNTDNEKRDGHLQSPDFFDATKFPTLSFVSTSFTKVAGNKYKLAGNLTMHGVTKPVTLDVTMNGPAVNPMSKKTAVGFKASGIIKRTDFSLSSMPTAVISDEVALTLNGEFGKQ